MRACSTLSGVPPPRGTLVDTRAPTRAPHPTPRPRPAPYLTDAVGTPEAVPAHHAHAVVVPPSPGRYQERMFAGGTFGLTEISTDHLKQLYRAVHRDEVRCPLNIVELTRIGLQLQADVLLAQLRGLDRDAVRVVLTCVLAERLRRS